MIENLMDAFANELESFVAFLPRLTLALLVAVLIYLAGRVIAMAAERVMKRSSLPGAYHSYFGTLVRGLFIFVGFLVFLNMIGYSNLATSLVAGGGLTAVMLGFAFKDIGENFLAGFFLAFSRPFNTDDLIESEGIQGRVKSIHLRHTHIRTSDGCDVFVPSAQLFTKSLRNYTLDGLRRGNFTVGIDYGDDLQAAGDLLLEQARATAGVLEQPAPTVQVRGFDPNYMELQLFFWINAKDQEGNLSAVRFRLMKNCRNVLRDNGFTFSSSVSTNVDMLPVDVRLSRE